MVFRLWEAIHKPGGGLMGVVCFIRKQCWTIVPSFTSAIIFTLTRHFYFFMSNSPGLQLFRKFSVFENFSCQTETIPKRRHRVHGTSQNLKNGRNHFAINANKNVEKIQEKLQKFFKNDISTYLFQVMIYLHFLKNLKEICWRNLYITDEGFHE